MTHIYDTYRPSWIVKDGDLTKPKLTEHQKKKMFRDFRTYQSLTQLANTLIIPPEAINLFAKENLGSTTQTTFGPGPKVLINNLLEAKEAFLFGPTADIEIELAGKRVELQDSQDRLEEALRNIKGMRGDLKLLEEETKAAHSETKATRDELIKSQALIKELGKQIMIQGQEMLELQKIVDEYRELQKQWEPKNNGHRTLEL